MMSSGGAVAALVAVVAARKREEIFRRFRERGALSPGAALTTADLGLGRTPLFRLQCAKGAVVEVGGGRFHLDEEAVQRQQRARRWVVLSLLVVVAVVFVVLAATN